MCLSDTANSFDFLLRCLGITPAEILFNRAREKKIHLKHHRNGIAQGPERVVRNRSAADLYNAFGYVIKTGYHLHKCRFSRARTADNSDGFARFYVKINAVNDVLLAVFLIFEADVFHIDIAVSDSKRGVCILIADFRLFGKNLCDTGKGGSRHNRHNENHRYHHQRHKNLIDVSDKRRKLGCTHR